MARVSGGTGQQTPGYELGRAELNTTQAITTTPTQIFGLSVPVVVPVGAEINLAIDIPWINITAAANTTVTIALYEDANNVRSYLTTIVASANRDIGHDFTYTPSSSGAHTYSAFISLSGGAGGTIEGGSVSGNNNPSLTVTVA